MSEWKKANTENYFLMAGRMCDRCRHIFGPKEHFWRREEKVSWFRGEDAVESICEQCKESQELEP